MNWLDNVPRPVIFAHRGVSDYAPENSIKSFQRAIEEGAEAIELDTRLTADGEVVVFHDHNLKRMTGLDKELRSLTLGQIRSLYVVQPGKDRSCRERIPTLEEVILAFRGRLYLNIELASYGLCEDILSGQVCIIVQQHKMEKDVLFSSFDPRKLIRIRHNLDEIPIALITLPGLIGRISETLFSGRLKPGIVHPHFKRITPDYIKAQHALGRRINAWTVNNGNDIRRLINWGIDGIITDFPALARRIREVG